MPAQDSSSPVGKHCRELPPYVSHPPVEAVVFAWGVNEDGQLGLERDQNNLMTPKVVEALLGVRFRGRSHLSAPLVGGSRNTLAIDAEGEVYSWGWNDRGTLGHGHRAPERKPRRVQALAGKHIEQVHVNGWHCLAVSTSGQLYAWGGNEYNQCAVNPDLRDVLVPTPCMSQLKVKQVACGGMHSLVLTQQGEVWMWGEPWGDFSLYLDRLPRKVPGAHNIAAISAGAFHNMALNKDGQVYTWGTNDFGQLGNGNTSYDIHPRRVVDLDDVPISDIATGGWHSLALSARGEVYAWGRGEYGRLGTGDLTGSSKLRPQKVLGLEGHRIVQISAGGTHTLVLSSKNRMFVWGRALFGRLGLGNLQQDLYSPVECCLPGGHDRWRVISITTGGRHSMCLALPVRDSGSSDEDREDDSEVDDLGIRSDEEGMESLGGAESDGSLLGRDVQLVMDGFTQQQLAGASGPVPATAAAVGAMGGLPSSGPGSVGGLPFSRDSVRSRSGRASANRSGRASVDHGPEQQLQQPQQMRAPASGGHESPLVGTPGSPRMPMSPRGTSALAATAVFDGAHQLATQQAATTQQQQQLGTAKWGGPIWPSLGTDMHSMVAEQEEQEDLEEEQKMEAAAAKNMIAAGISVPDPALVERPHEGEEGEEEGGEKEEGGAEEKPQEEGDEFDDNEGEVEPVRHGSGTFVPLSVETGASSSERWHGSKSPHGTSGHGRPLSSLRASTLMSPARMGGSSMGSGGPYTASHEDSAASAAAAVLAAAVVGSPREPTSLLSSATMPHSSSPMGQTASLAATLHSYADPAGSHHMPLYPHPQAHGMPQHVPAPPAPAQHTSQHHTTMSASREPSGTEQGSVPQAPGLQQWPSAPSAQWRGPARGGSGSGVRSSLSGKLSAKAAADAAAAAAHGAAGPAVAGKGAERSTDAASAASAGVQQAGGENSGSGGGAGAGAAEGRGSESGFGGGSGGGTSQAEAGAAQEPPGSTTTAAVSSSEPNKAAKSPPLTPTRSRGSMQAGEDRGSGGEGSPGEGAEGRQSEEPKGVSPVCSLAGGMAEHGSNKRDSELDLQGQSHSLE